MRITFLFILSLISLNVCSQESFKIIQSKNNNTEVIFSDEELESTSVKIKNKTRDSLVLGWRCIKNTLNEDWDYAICEYGRCFAGIPDSSVIKAIPPKEKGFINLHLDPDLISGTGEVIFEIYEVKNESVKKNIFFTVIVKEKE